MKIRVLPGDGSGPEITAATRARDLGGRVSTNAFAAAMAQTVRAAQD